MGYALMHDQGGWGVFEQEGDINICAGPCSIDENRHRLVNEGFVYPRNFGVETIFF
jgi:hypothetical protein